LPQGEEPSDEVLQRKEHAMPTYIIAEIQITDSAAYDEYRPLAAASIARFGGRFYRAGW
jgi:uncharacterized protein DUF1330